MYYLNLFIAPLVAHRDGFEPSTYALTGRCTNQTMLPALLINWLNGGDYRTRTCTCTSFSGVDSHYPKSPLLVGEAGLAPAPKDSQSFLLTTYTIRPH